MKDYENSNDVCIVTLSLKWLRKSKSNENMKVSKANDGEKVSL
jgi:hypothetical protein